MRSKKVWRHHCDYCGRGLWKKRDCLEHEDRCFSNPSTKACLTCGDFVGRDDEGEAFCQGFGKFLVAPGQKGLEVMKFRTDCDMWRPKNDNTRI